MSRATRRLLRAVGIAAAAASSVLLLLLLQRWLLQGQLRVSTGETAGPWIDELRTLTKLLPTLERMANEHRRRHFVSYHPDYDTFVRNLIGLLEMHQMRERPLVEVFLRDGTPTPRPQCNGTWMEFGVHLGNSVNISAGWRERNCPPDVPDFFGFDTFTGLPEDWSSYSAGMFSTDGQLPPVHPSVRLVAGLFNDSLPVLLAEQDAASPTGRLPNLTYLHVDCDLYAGASDALTLLNDRLAPGAMVIFDELVNYPDYRNHEMKALFEWLGRTGRELEVFCIRGPLDGKDYAVELTPSHDLGGFQQSVGFIVVS